MVCNRAGQKALSLKEEAFEHKERQVEAKWKAATIRDIRVLRVGASVGAKGMRRLRCRIGSIPIGISQMLGRYLSPCRACPSAIGSGFPYSLEFFTRVKLLRSGYLSNVC
jgi:hypothetical protein